MDGKEELYEQLNEEIDQVWEDPGCNGSCSSCGGDCGSTQAPRQAKRAYAVVSGKGGTGKSLVTAMLAVALRRRGLTVGILDADVAGASIARLLGDRGQIVTEGELMLPHSTEDGIRLISMDLIADNPEDPIIWSDADTANIAALFWTGVNWGDLDCLLVDMPSGFGDISLNFFTTLPLDGAIITATPGETTAGSVRKMINLCTMLMLPITGFVENMAGLSGSGTAGLYHLPENCVTVSLPFDPALSGLADSGRIRESSSTELSVLAESIAQSVKSSAE